MIHTQPALPELESLLWGKRCPKCGEIKPLTEYHRDATHKDGSGSRCKVCDAARRRAYHEAHREEDSARGRAYHEAHKEEANAWSRAYYEAHKKEIAARQAAYREIHKKEIAARDRAYRKTPQGRAVNNAVHARRRGNPGLQALTADMIQEVTEASDGICPYCGETFEDGHIDHIIPVSKGGTNDRENLVYCCAHCNLSKRDKDLEDWLNWTNERIEDDR